MLLLLLKPKLELWPDSSEFCELPPILPLPWETLPDAVTVGEYAARAVPSNAAWARALAQAWRVCGLWHRAWLT
ncbi:hypothetical protein, partial [Methylogaea oryzae]|uniref:hypothetical protein n=1 Tax=Methylogaea oryzae TaxID=1295382 RepID=UPI0026E58628